MNWIKVVLTTKRENEELVVDRLYEFEIDGVTVKDNDLYFKHAEEGPDWELVDLPETRTDDILLEVFFEEEEYRKSIKKDLEDLISSFENIEVRLVSEELIDNTDWATEWMKYYEVLEIGETIAIVPSWKDYNGERKNIVRLDPGMAFGTGDHGSTSMCLRLIEKENPKGKSFLDIGTGSGILAIAAKKLGAEKVVGTDIDPVCIEVAGNNAKDNQTDIEFVETDLTSKLTGKFDIVCANIIAEIIVNLLDHVGNFMNKDSVLLVSGILDSKADMVIEKAEQVGFKPADILHDRGWTAIKLVFNE